jgi:hypothetical protein
MLPTVLDKSFEKMERSLAIFNLRESYDAVETFQPGMGQAETFSRAYEFGELPQHPGADSLPLIRLRDPHSS